MRQTRVAITLSLVAYPAWTAVPGGRAALPGLSQGGWALDAMRSPVHRAPCAAPPPPLPPGDDPPADAAPPLAHPARYSPPLGWALAAGPPPVLIAGGAAVAD